MLASRCVWSWGKKWSGWRWIVAFYVSRLLARSLVLVRGERVGMAARERHARWTVKRMVGCTAEQPALIQQRHCTSATLARLSIHARSPRASGWRVNCDCHSYTYTCLSDGGQSTLASHHACCCCPDWAPGLSDQAMLTFTHAMTDTPPLLCRRVEDL
jgi:hypothetical protein